MVALDDSAVLLLVAVLKPELTPFLFLPLQISEQVKPDDFGGQLPILPVTVQDLRDTSEQHAHGGEPLLAVDDAMCFHNAGAL